jgi:hypothetical protein
MGGKANSDYFLNIVGAASFLNVGSQQVKPILEKLGVRPVREPMEGRSRGYLWLKSEVINALTHARPAPNGNLAIVRAKQEPKPLPEPEPEPEPEASDDLLKGIEDAPALEPSERTKLTVNFHLSAQERTEIKDWLKSRHLKLTPWLWTIISREIWRK